MKYQYYVVSLTSLTRTKSLVLRRQKLRKRIMFQQRKVCIHIIRILKNILFVIKII